MTNAQMAAAFNEWMRRFIEEPDRFNREFEDVNAFLVEQGAGKKPSYGEACASYITQLAKEIPAQ